MSVVVTFQNYLPPSRYDALPWTEVRIEESDECEGTYTQIDTLALSPLDADPEDPALRSFTTENGTDEDMWYRVVFADADGDTTVPTTPVQHIATGLTPVVAYASVSELARILGLGGPANGQSTASAPQLEAMQRVLDAAASAISSYLGRASALTEPYPAAIVSANLEIAEDLWRYEQVPYGAVVLGGEGGAVYPARRMLARLSPLLTPYKESWGVG